MPENTVTFQSRERRGPPEPEEIALDVLYEDDCLIVINKPAGMVVHPTYKNWTGTVLNGLLWRVGPGGPQGPAMRTPSIVTRLDKDTSGLVIAALRPDVHARIQKDGAAGRVIKEYLAFVHGIPSPSVGTISLPLARSEEDRRLVVVTESGQASETRYEVLSSANGMSVVRCQLVTGRTHQIRVHLADRGWPIVGDLVYGKPHDAIGRQALHASRVRMPHPFTRIPMEFQAPAPQDFEALLSSSHP